MIFSYEELIFYEERFSGYEAGNFFDKAIYYLALDPANCR
jgi:hypothetical protein